jgi:uncharacterized coiled-coil DUF342 family protein
MAEAKSKLEKLREELLADRKNVTDKSAPHRAERDRLLKKIQPLEDELRVVNQKIKKIEQPALGEIDTQIGKIAVALGGRSLSGANAK